MKQRKNKQASMNFQSREGRGEEATAWLGMGHCGLRYRDRLSMALPHGSAVS